MAIADKPPARVDDPENSGPLPLWLQLIAAGIPAVLAPYFWVLDRDRGKFLSFHLLLLPIYIPLAFGLIWPLILEIQSLCFPADRQRYRLRHTIAAVLFIVCLLPSLYFGFLEYRSYAEDEDIKRGQAQAVAAQMAAYDAETKQATETLNAKGIDGFIEPLTVVQERVLTNYLASHAKTLTAEDVARASEHYCCNALVLAVLAGAKNAPPEALQKIYEKAQQLDGKGTGLDGVLPSLASNPNTPVPIVVAALQSDEPSARAFAAGNPNMPKDLKIAYLRRAANSKMIDDRIAAADNPETPPDVLEKLSTDPEVCGGVATNQGTPTEVLRIMATEAKSELVRSLAKRSLEFRQSQH